ncbi:aminotransferase-like domain-containing protein [Gimesia maris]|uniref:2-aminoadipate transaminase n=1 Tax=Gimesia maris TaxID=122 RepID=A0ABX5YWI0_9PLAN|nr:PLP-dependent aminotransferase family protein [Gimesia maris]EDL60540.1 aminotransferase [Gimesia maris DSM 8797]QEG19943.1 2-aminoadipate transaminase [Gimesia maris]QGQ27254.1 PLP-dependent aminotransferase family protein [Gimesia maris]
MTDSNDIQFSRKRTWSHDLPISYLMQQGVENPGVLSLAAGLVDQNSLPVSITQSAFQSLFSDPGSAREALQYGTTAGSLSFRKLLLAHLSHLEQKSAEELRMTVDNIIVTTGSQQYLSLLGEVLLDPGDICLVAAPTYFVFLGVLQGLGARIISVDTDESGMKMDSLDTTLERLEAQSQLNRVKMIYLVSDYENPSGVSLSIDRRKKVVEIAQKWSKQHRIHILEDLAYRELCYDGPVLPSIRSFDQTGETVILTQTFSKSFAPGLRVGFGVASKSVCEAISDKKGNDDFGSTNLSQHILANALRENLYYDHVEYLRSVYREKRDCMLDAAETYFSKLKNIHWIHPGGGLYVWMTLPDSIETGFKSTLFQKAIHEDKVMYVPGELFYAYDHGLGCNEQPAIQKNHMRLTFGVQNSQGIQEGMKRLSNAVKSFI